MGGPNGVFTRVVDQAMPQYAAPTPMGMRQNPGIENGESRGGDPVQAERRGPESTGRASRMLTREDDKTTISRKKLLGS